MSRPIGRGTGNSDGTQKENEMEAENEMGNKEPKEAGVTGRKGKKTGDVIAVIFAVVLGIAAGAGGTLLVLDHFYESRETTAPDLARVEEGDDTVLEEQDDFLRENDADVSGLEGLSVDTDDNRSDMQAEGEEADEETPEHVWAEATCT